jgi:hypothetical protein
LLSAFGSPFGETSSIDLISGSCSAEILSRDHKLYLVGWPRVNLVAAEAIEMIQGGSKVLRRFDTGGRRLGRLAGTLSDRPW